MAVKSDSEDDFLVIEDTHSLTLNKLKKEHQQVIRDLNDKHIGELAMLRDSCYKRSQNAISTASASIDRRKASFERRKEEYEMEIDDLKDELAAEKAKVAQLLLLVPPHLRGRAPGQSRWTEQ
ncbi:hypothetical protein BDP55DRAFT_728295 [Colletotrichum godetiae]|uniref:Uncharacterized protein n=1 Tax=Colletotrichum godetiae TaxID=1209918 RepID=A0AAJ0EU97_9PEZI|nr:uncharacterized protein BDP55DRAFT_728295 [Colletotrichum godetiae]KAK1675937.1 hypothetical protein BDP55DRAFT_728295 [Colletotrichum godetiae]